MGVRVSVSKRLRKYIDPVTVERARAYRWRSKRGRAYKYRPGWLVMRACSDLRSHGFGGNMASVSKRLRKHLDPVAVELARAAVAARNEREHHEAEQSRQALLVIARAARARLEAMPPPGVGGVGRWPPMALVVPAEVDAITFGGSFSSDPP